MFGKTPNKKTLRLGKDIKRVKKSQGVMKKDQKKSTQGAELLLLKHIKNGQKP